MNSMEIIQHFFLIVFVICRIMREVQSQDCEVIPLNDNKKIPIVVYVNGGTDVDQLWLSRFCGWQDEGFDYDKYAPVTIKVGAIITCNKGVCSCPNDENAKADCAATFLNVCAAVELGDAEYINFQCCTEAVDPTTQKSKGFDKCVSERPQLKEKIDACMAKVGADSPQEIALKHAKEIVDNGVVIADSGEPFFFFEGKYSSCINNHVFDMWLETICSFLDTTLAHTISQCKTVMKW